MTRSALLAALLLPLLAVAEATPRRFALVAGQNVGDGADETLRYADEDARRFMAVMLEVGGVAPKDAVAVYGATVPALRKALADLEQRLSREATGRDQLVVYVSSHADSGELHLAGGRFPLAELQAFLARAPVGVALLVVDSCRSGALTRVKGLRPVEGTKVEIDTAEIRGRVIITSSGEDEYSQESDELGGSYFTHHFVSGLRGAADSSRDGRITLEEGYAYAYARTLESTFATRGGTQRPSYRVDLKGQGELVLSETARATGRIAIGVEEASQWQVVSDDSGRMIAQFSKQAGPATVAVPPGRYRVRMKADDGYFEGMIAVPSRGEAAVDRARLVQVPGSGTLALKGAGRGLRLAIAGTGSTGLVTGLVATFGAEVQVQRSQRFGIIDALVGTVGYRRGTGSLKVAFDQQEIELRAGVLKRVALGSTNLTFGPEAGALLALQDNLPGGDHRTGLGATLGATAGVSIPLRGPISAFVGASGGVVLIRKDSGLGPTLRGGGSAGISFDL